MSKVKRLAKPESLAFSSGGTEDHKIPLGSVTSTAVHAKATPPKAKKKNKIEIYYM